MDSHTINNSEALAMVQDNSRSHPLSTSPAGNPASVQVLGVTTADQALQIGYETVDEADEAGATDEIDQDDEDILDASSLGEGQDGDLTEFDAGDLTGSSPSSADGGPQIQQSLPDQNPLEDTDDHLPDLEEMPSSGRTGHQWIGTNG